MLATPEILRETAQRAEMFERLATLRHVPLYRNRLDTSGPGADFSSLPFVTKADMRADFPANFLGRQTTLDALLAEQAIELEYTSGTSQDRLPVIFGRGWWNEQEQRALRLNRVVAEVLNRHPAARRATLTSPTCNGLTCPAVWMSREQRTLEQTLFLNLARIPFVLPESELARMAREIQDWTPQFLDLDPVHGAWFAQFCERQGLRFPSLRFVICSYEFVSVIHRRLIERAFGVPVFNLYGSTETGHLLMENERGEMKPSLETAFLELAQPDSRGVGELIVTTLSNAFMPLLRYRIGDLVERIERPYATQYVVHGRARDAIMSDRGDRITTWQVDQCFKDVEGVAHYELRQDPAGFLRLRYLAAGGGPTERALRQAASRLQALFGRDEPVAIESVSTLVPTTSGKFRLTCRTED
jgi:phenylacetate-CoA ligase